MAESSKVLCFVVLTVASCFSQKADPAPATPTPANAHPVIFQRTSPTVEAASRTSTAQLSPASFRLAGEGEMDGMERTLSSFVTAFENLNLSGIRQIWPDLDRQHAAAFKDLFAGFKGASANPQMALQCAVPKVSAEMANVDCRETITYQVGKGKGKAKELGPVKVSIQMKGESGAWMVSDMKGAE